MKPQFIITFCIFVLTISCSAYKPFSSLQEKKASIKEIKNTFSLTPEEFKLIKDEDSILYEISESLDKKVKFYTTNRRIDSFLNGNYVKKQMLIALNVDQLKLRGEFDFDYTDRFKGRRLNFNTVEEYEQFMKKMDSSFRKKIKVKTDTIKN